MEANAPDPSTTSPKTINRLTPAQKHERLAMLARQERLRGSSQELTDVQCARRLGLKVPTWTAWKKRFLDRTPKRQDSAETRQGAARGPASGRRRIRRLTEDQERRRRAVLERQELASTSGQMRMTDQQCAESLGISRHAWIAWKVSRRRKDARSETPPKSPPRPGRTRDGEELAKQIERMIHHAFDRGQRAIACLKQIRELIDKTLTEDRR